MLTNWVILLRARYKYNHDYFCLQTPVKEHEVMIFCNSPGTDMFRLFYYVIQTYYKLESVCFSTGLALPVINSKNRPSLPAIIRIGTRGQCNSHTNDVSSLDLYMVCILIPAFRCIYVLWCPTGNCWSVWDWSCKSFGSDTVSLSVAERLLMLWRIMLHSSSGWVSSRFMDFFTLQLYSTKIL